MKLINLLLMMAFLLTGPSMEAQFIKKLKKRAERAAEEGVIRATEKKVYKESKETTEDVLNGKKSEEDKSQDPKNDKDPNVANNKGNQGNDDQEDDNQNNNDPKNTTTAKGDKKADRLEPWSKYNFVPGDEIIFEDDLSTEENGEFPSRWDLLGGNAENASSEETGNIINMMNKTTITPLMDEAEYLPEVFTIEFDAYFDEIKKGFASYQQYNIRFWPGTSSWYTVRNDQNDYFYPVYIYRNGAKLSTRVNGQAREYKSYEESLEDLEPVWRHVAISFNKRSLKVFIDQHRVLNIPNVAIKPTMFSVGAKTHYDDGQIRGIKNIRIAEGGKKLYDRIIADGKIVTRGILFDVNKSTIKPESSGVLNSMVKMMEEHPDLNLSVEGHTDSDGKEDYNLQLSEERALAVKSALVSLGIDSSRLKTKGFGESVPVSDNGSPEGKANNRRVEFVKF